MLNKNTKIIIFFCVIMSLSIGLLHMFHCYTKAKEFAFFLTRVEKHANIIASNSYFINSLQNGATRSTRRHLEDNLKNHSTPLIQGFLVISKEREIVASAVIQDSSLSVSIASLFVQNIGDLDTDYFDDERLLVIQPVTTAKGFFIGAVVGMEEIKDIFKVRSVKHDRKAFRVKQFDTIGIIEEDIGDYVFVALFWFFLLVTQIRSERKIRDEILKSHDCVRHEFADIFENIEQTLKMIPRAILKKDIQRVDDLLHDIQVHTGWADNLLAQLGNVVSNTKIQLGPLSLADIAEGLQKDTFVIYNQKIAKFSLSIQTRDLVFSDQNVLSIILLNLIKNAVNHKKRSSKKINMRVFKSKEGSVSFSITNEGLIEKRVLKKIFHPRIKGKNSNGSGIGLHYAKKLVLRLGGNIQVSQVAEQVSVCLTLPLYKKGNS